MATIEIDGEQYEVESGRMLIEAADEAGVYIPRFCYHKKLTVAANCRMCLVEVDKMRKPMPACATPVADGMKVFTKSKLAIDAQRAVMEFLLINHPLDCPICDQGGECELQDVSMGYGADISQYTEGKRSVDDEDIGSLIATDMTRCIHCTRCVRFGEEVAGIRELGATGRGEDMKIGTFVKHSLTSPVAGNIIDLCPVGALTSKPYRYTARSWEMQSKPTIAPHDCLGSNINAHVRRQQVMRVVPEDNEEINECWISDRDRFSYSGVDHPERVSAPMVKQNGQWIETDWPTAFQFVVSHLKRITDADPKQLGVMASPSSTLEEFYLLQKLARGLGCHNIDHRTHEIDFSDQDFLPLFPGSSLLTDDLEQQGALLIVGGHIQQDVPLLATRIRKASLSGAKVSSISAVDYPLNHPQAQKILADLDQFPVVLGEIAVALAGDQLPKEFAPLLRALKPRAEARDIATQLKNEDSVIILGHDAQHHPQASAIRSLIKLISQLANADVMQLTMGANAAGGWLAGALPHRQAAGKPVSQAGMHCVDMLKQPRKAYLLHGIEPEFDLHNPKLALDALKQAEMVCVLSPYRSKTMMDYADVILPTSVFTETSGTYVNLSGHWQRFNGCTKPVGEARPAWKVIRVLGNLLKLPDFDYLNTQEIADEVSAQIEGQTESDFDTWYYPKQIDGPSQLRRVGRWAIYKTDNLVRRAKPLQQAASQDPLEVRVSPKLAEQYNLRNGKVVTVMQEGNEITLPVFIDSAISDNTVYMVSGYEHPNLLGEAYGVVELK